jgi:hypothetical protein
MPAVVAALAATAAHVLCPRLERKKGIDCDPFPTLVHQSHLDGIPRIL